MNIYSKHGDKVIFDHPNAGYDCDQEKAKKHLIVGNVYTVDYTNVHSCSTTVFLVEFPKAAFNSVLFSDFTTKKSFREVTDKFEKIYWPDGEHVLEQDKWRQADKEFEKYLETSGWTHDEWLSEQFNKVLKDNKD